MAHLWGKDIVVNEKEALLEDFSFYLETSLMITIEKFKSIIILQKAGWLNDARDFLANTLPEVCKDAEKYLVFHNIINPPNWRIFLRERLDVAKQAGQLLYSFHEDCCNSCISQYQMEYQSTYEQQLARQDGLGFGIISNSFTAHLLYAAQSVRKDIENEKKAREATEKIMHTASPIDRAIQMTIAFYHKSFDPFVVDFLIGFYSDLEKLIYDGLDVDKEQLENRKALSENELSNITRDNHRETITSSLSKYPFNSNALLWAIRYNDVDDELISFCLESPRLYTKYLHMVEKSAIAYLKDQDQKAKLYNRDSLTEDVIQFLKGLRAFLMDERVAGTSIYENIIKEMYGFKIGFTTKKFYDFLEISQSHFALSNYAKNHKIFYISQSDVEDLKKYNSIFGTSELKKLLDAIPNDAEVFEDMVDELCEQVKA